MMPAATMETADARLIRCYLPKGRAMETAERLHGEKGIEAVNFASGRGRATLETVSFGAWVEVDILYVVVAPERADEIFDFIYEIADIDRLHGGLMVQGRLTAATAYTLPAEPSEP
jgi:hypothetical protein